MNRLWTWIRGAKDERWGRLFVQDTFGIHTGSRLEQSHVAARTGEQVGLDQIGAFYGNTPYHKQWLYETSFTQGFDPRDTDAIAKTISIMERANATHLVLTDPLIVPGFERDPRFEVVETIERFVVLRLRGAVPRWAVTMGGAGAVALERSAPGHLRLTADPSIARIVISESFHPFWAARTAGIRITPDADGFIQVERTEPSPAVVDMEYSPPRSPLFVSLAGAAAIVLLFVLGVSSTRPRTAPAPAAT
jgi:hypothetical protein